MKAIDFLNKLNKMCKDIQRKNEENGFIPCCECSILNELGKCELNRIAEPHQYDAPKMVELVRNYEIKKKPEEFLQEFKNNLSINKLTKMIISLPNHMNRPDEVSCDEFCPIREDNSFCTYDGIGRDKMVCKEALERYFEL